MSITTYVFMEKIRTVHQAETICSEQALVTFLKNETYGYGIWY